VAGTRAFAAPALAPLVVGTRASVEPKAGRLEVEEAAVGKLELEVAAGMRALV